jgi:hypothetical protein
MARGVGCVWQAGRFDPDRNAIVADFLGWPAVAHTGNLTVATS